MGARHEAAAALGAVVRRICAALWRGDFAAHVHAGVRQRDAVGVAATCRGGPAQQTLFPGLHSVRTTTSAAGSCCGEEPEGSRTELAIYSAWPLMPSIAAPRPWATTCVE